MRRKLHGLIVRPLAPADHARWGAMRQQLWPEPGRDEVAEIARLQVPVVVLVAERGEALVGFAEATIRSVVDGHYFAPAAYLEGIWVEPAVRRQGIAGALLDGVIAWAREQGVTAIGSDAMAGDRPSIAWHRQAGFAVEDEVVRFLRPLD